jgi:hypothetical protein
MNPTTKEINRDLRTSRFRTSRPDLRETLTQIVAIANHASDVRLRKAKSPVIQSARCPSPTSKLPAKFIPAASPAQVSNWNAKRIPTVGGKR